MLRTEHTPEPEVFAKEYTRYYEHESSDSPEEGRAYLRARMLEAINTQLQDKQTVRVLDIGAGKQIFEHELENDPAFESLRERVQIFTVDIASLYADQLLTEWPHFTMDAAALHFPDDFFDVVFSCMALDFMPEEAFFEAQRVLKDKGDFLVNYHHPNLVSIAEMAKPEVEAELRRAGKVLTRKGASTSNRANKARSRYEKAVRTLADVQFVLQQFPHLIFHSLEEIAKFYTNTLQLKPITLEEHPNRPGKNGWYFAHTKKQS